MALMAAFAGIVSLAIHAQNAIGAAAFEAARGAPIAFSSSPLHDRERRRFFSRHLTPACLIESTHMESPGVWVVVCSSDETLRFVFDRGGHLVQRTVTRPWSR